MRESSFRKVTSLVWISLFWASVQALAWDGHIDLTRESLKGFEKTNAQLLKTISQKVTVTRIEDFLAKAFGSGCSWELAVDKVFDGLGRDYKVFYTPAIRYWATIDWDKGVNQAFVVPVYPEKGVNPHGVGQSVSAADVLAVYSDEPDWVMDDDVERLSGKGVVQAKTGTATRMLRHFWYEGERVMSSDFGKDQETDARLQLYYELSLLAFKVGEPYWGYRFLGNALHFVQDLTQPFHVKAVIGGKIVDKLGVARAALCDFNREGGRKPAEGCPPEVTLDNAVIQNGWVVGAYHALYEDYVEGMMMSAEKFNTQNSMYIRGLYKKVDGEPAVSELDWGSEALLDAKALVRGEQKDMLQLADEIGDACYETFGTKYRYYKEETRKALIDAMDGKTFAYRLGAFGETMDLYNELSDRQHKSYPILKHKTHAVLVRIGEWTRSFLERSLANAKDPAILETVGDRLLPKILSCGR